jgi:putative endonuclease
MHFVYVLRSQNFPKSYVGMTNNIERRIQEHNSGKHVYTKRHLPWDVIWKEQYDTLKDARVREKYLKSAAGRKFLKAKVFV